MQLIMIDVAKTERANNEAPGSFFRHMAQAEVAAYSPPPTKRAARTLTNMDIEPIRQRRIESEKNYERRRIELGLPSIEETRRRQALEGESTLTLARQRAADQARDEAYWRKRASALRSDFNSVDAQIEYLRSRLVQNQGPIYNYGSYPNVYGNPNIYGNPNVYGSYPNGLPYPSAYERRRYNQEDKLDNLLMRRAELEALWRTLEDDARNARVPQAWLLP